MDILEEAMNVFTLHNNPITSIVKREARKMLGYKPDEVVDDGDEIYWDLVATMTVSLMSRMTGQLSRELKDAEEKRILQITYEGGD